MSEESNHHMGGDPESDEAVIYEADGESGDATSGPVEDRDAGAESSPVDIGLPHRVQSMTEMMAIIEALIFVSEEPLSVKSLVDVLKQDRKLIESALEGLATEFNARDGGLHLRELAGGWQFATRPEHLDQAQNSRLHHWRRWR
jgi:hypothetical protein